jgi:glycosyltransferase involved in cell wall biosynthesis
VELVANAPSLDSLYRGARLVVAPLRLGGGTRVKLLEAMAYGAAIVATETAAEGLALQDGANARIAGTPEAFARACSDLLADPDAAGQIGAAARETWLNLYTPEVARDAVMSLVNALRPTFP